MNSTLRSTGAQRLESAIIAFFVLAALFALVVYAVDPSIYTQTLKLTAAGAERYPWPTTLFLAGLVVFIALLIVGVRRHWRWLFWLLLLAFGASILQVPAEVLQLTGVLPMAGPLWYGLSRTGVAVVEVGLAIWMVGVYRREGVWGMGRGKGVRKV
ncbi:MAG TPA: hypothetical protein VKR06_00195 [Ktedonosporobacter sp.]|nr:hypothetical protein [Ktedonosporobacter sp.]